MSQTIAVILSGSGVFDGSEIHEAVLTLLALEKQGAEVACFAPNVEQMHVIDHGTGEVMPESRNVLVESARITRGAVSDLATYDPADFDALVMAGGFGAAKNLSNFAVAGAECTVHADVAKAVETTHAAGKTIGAMCVAPIILAKLIAGASITLGGEGDASSAATAMGANHQVADHGKVVVDTDNNIATTPAYMLDATMAQIEEGTAALVETVLKMAAS